MMTSAGRQCTLLDGVRSFSFSMTFIRSRRFDLTRDAQDPQLLHFYVECSKGTYLRSLADDFTRAAGTCGHLVALRRERVGKFRVSDAFTLAKFAAEAGPRSKVKSFKPPKIQLPKKGHRPKDPEERKRREAEAEAQTQEAGARAETAQRRPPSGDRPVAL